LTFSLLFLPSTFKLTTSAKESNSFKEEHFLAFPNANLSTIS
jgi:hypothetical protein